jgi:predicted outer membrane protein
MRLRLSRHVLASCGLAALCLLTACAGYTPTPTPDSAALSTEPPTIDPEPTDADPDAGAAGVDSDSAGTGSDQEAAGVGSGPEAEGVSPDDEPAGSNADSTGSNPESSGSDPQPTGLDAAPTDSGTNPAASSPAQPDAATDTGIRQTKWGPLTKADRDLIQKVRLASLWEMPMAMDAIERASNARVRQISKEIAAQHGTLDRQVRDVAAKLKVTLPTKPTDQQQGWMDDISSKSGAAYDTTYVKWLRLAHGQIFPLIGTVRGSTQNTLVRRFSEQANAAVLNHQRLLESTGLTSPASFPTPAS